MKRAGVPLRKHVVVVLQDVLKAAASKGTWKISFENALQCAEIPYQENFLHYSKGDNICPCCTKRRAYPGVNTFAALQENLMNRWSWQNNYLLCDPDQILERYNKVVWWECPKCKQLYRCSPQKILYYEKRHMESCSFCKGYRRKQRHFI